MQQLRTIVEQQLADTSSFAATSADHAATSEPTTQIAR
jgi:hypothetical protein